MNPLPESPQLFERNGLRHHLLSRPELQLSQRRVLNPSGGLLRQLVAVHLSRAQRASRWSPHRIHTLACNDPQQSSSLLYPDSNIPSDSGTVRFHIQCADADQKLALSSKRKPDSKAIEP